MIFKNSLNLILPWQILAFYIFFEFNSVRQVSIKLIQILTSNMAPAQTTNSLNTTFSGDKLQITGNNNRMDKAEATDRISEHVQVSESTSLSLGPVDNDISYSN